MILKKGINVLHKKNAEVDKDKRKLERENYDFRTKQLPELQRLKQLVGQFFPNNKSEPN